MFGRVLLCFAATSVLAAADLGVLVDLSGSMAHYGAWQPDALALVRGIAQGNPGPARELWTVKGDSAALPEFACGNNCRFAFLRFGSLRQPKHPFFQPIQTLDGIAALESVFPRAGAEFTEARTNRSLAQAVVAQALAPQGGSARLIVISDFLADSTLNQEQQAYVTDSESRTTVVSPLIFSWKRDNRVQIRLVQFNVRPPEPPQPPQPPEPPPQTKNGPQGPEKEHKPALLQLLPAKLLSSPRRLQFGWKYAEPDKVRDYEIHVRDARPPQKQVFSKQGLIAASVQFRDPPKGTYRWHVVAKLEDGGEVRSETDSVTVPGGGWDWLLWAVPPAALIALLLVFLKRRKSRDREEKEAGVAESPKEERKKRKPAVSESDNDLDL